VEAINTDALPHWDDRSGMPTLSQ
jgi:hypothetical protein